MEVASYAHQSIGLPFAKSFSGHETFAFRHSWLKKGVDFLSRDPEIFQREDAVVHLGVGKNMVRSIRHWCLATRVAQEEPRTRSKRLHPTDLGRRLLSDDGWDPFLEDDGTLWLIHWNLASAGTRAATWYWGFNRLQEYAFTRPTLSESLLRDLHMLGWSDVSPGTIKRDVDCFVQTYLSRTSVDGSINNDLECPVTSLDILIQEPDSERLRFRMGPKETLPAAIFTYALLEFWNQGNSANTLQLREILRAEGSPGLVFKLDQESVLSYLDRLEDVTSQRIVFEDTPLVRRVVKLGNLPSDPMFLLEDYYGAH
jgi:hypothetical protein